MGAFPGRNSIMVMDNSAIHRGGRLAELCDAAQVLLIYLPPYSPDLNPVKKVFSALKEQIKQHPILTGTEDDSDTIKRFMYAFVTPELMKGFFLASSYSA
jgi:transposase